MIYSRDGFVLYMGATWNDNEDPPAGKEGFRNNGHVDPWEVKGGTAYVEGVLGDFYEAEIDQRTGMPTKISDKPVDPKTQPKLYKELQKKADARWNQG
ncbi:hypothetical protein KY312_04780, partial [Candidatus Woesearchaeota archaeon]|nr:hypothetical protein [Candidatus Woesearchaeota archaeon]